MGEITVNVPEPEPTPPAAPASDTSHLALALGELKGELAAQKTVSETILHKLEQNEGVLQEIAARTEALLQSESEDPESESHEPESVAIPAPLLAETEPPRDPTTPEFPHREAPRKRLGMFHGW